MKHLPFPRWRRKGESLPSTGNFVPQTTTLRRDPKAPTWKAGTLPTELLPLSPAILALKYVRCQKLHPSFGLRKSTARIMPSGVFPYVF